MNALGGLLVVLAAWLGGRALLPSRSLLPRSSWEEQCAAYLLGTALLPLAAMAATALGIPFHSPLALGLLGAAALAGLWRLRHERAPLRAAALGRPAAALLLLLGAGSVLLTLAWPLNEFDPILHFAYKGKLLYFEGDPSGEGFTGVGGAFGRIMTHPNYPLGIPFLEAFAAHAGGGWSDRWVQVPLALWSACLPGAVSLAMRDQGSSRARAAALCAACTPILYARGFLAHGFVDLARAGLGEEKMLGGRGDLPLAAFCALGLAFLLRARQCHAPTARRHLAVLAGLAFAGGVMTKNEGLALLAVLACTVLLSGPLERGRHLGPGLLAVAVALLASGPWLAHRSQLPSIDEDYAAQVSVERIEHYLTNDEDASAAPVRPEVYGADWSASSHWRPARIARYFGGEFVNPLSWGVLWILAAWGILKGFRDPEVHFLGIFLLGGLALYALILLVTPWFLPALHRKGIPARLMLHLLPPAALLAVRVWPQKEEVPSG